jgi:hypothetical protein
VDSTYYAIENRQTFSENFGAKLTGAAYPVMLRQEELAAELTSAIYPLVLANRPKDSWVTVELGLWNALSETVKRWVRLRAAAESMADLTAWQEGFLVELTQSAYQVAIKNGISRSLDELKLGLCRAVRGVTRRHSAVAVFE